VRDHAPHGSGPLEGLAPTAVRLLEGARRLLERSGYASITLDAVAREAGETKSLIRYHFGSKQGLLVALVDWLMHEYTDQQRRLVSGAMGSEDRLHHLAESLIRMMHDSDSYRLFFDLMSNLVQDPEMRPRAAGLLMMWRNLTASVLQPAQAQGVPKEVMTLSSMTLALADGLALQLLADPESVDVELAMDIWERSLVATLPASG
jgi:AcrR family transcriptional regulator